MKQHLTIKQSIVHFPLPANVLSTPSARQVSRVMQGSPMLCVNFDPHNHVTPLNLLHVVIIPTVNCYSTGIRITILEEHASMGTSCSDGCLCCHSINCV